MTAAAATPAPAAKPRPQRRLRRWLLRLLVLGIALRIALALTLPWLVERALGLAGFEATCAAASLSFSGASVHVHGLQVRDASQKNGFAASAQEVIADLSTWQLLHGRVAVSNLLLSGPHVDVWTRTDGSFVLPASAAAAPIDAAAPTASGPWSLAPIAIATARLHDVRLRVFGPDGDEPRQTYLVDATLLDLGRTDRPCTLDVRFANPQQVDTLNLTGSLSTSPDRAALTWNLVVRGFAAAPLLGADVVRDEPLVIDAAGELTASRDARGTIALRTAAALHGPGLVDELAFSARASLRAEGGFELDAEARMHRLAPHAFTPLLERLGVTLPGDGVDAKATLSAQRAADGALSARLADVSLTGGGEILTLQELAIAGHVARTDEIRVHRLASVGPVANVRRHADGAIACCGVRWRPPAVVPQPPAPPAPAAGNATQRFRLDQLESRGITVRYDEDTADGPRALVLDGAAVLGDGLAFGPDLATGRLTIDLPLPDVVRGIRIDVHGKPAGNGIAADMTLAADGIVLRRLQPWLTPLGLTSTFRDGSLRASCAMATRGDAPHVDLHIANVRVADGDVVWVGLRNAELTGFRAVDGGATWQTCAIDEPLLRVDRGPAGIAIAGLRIAPPPATAPAAAPATPTTTPPLPTFAALATGPMLLRGATLRLATGDDDDDPRHAIGLDGSIGAFANGAPVPFEIAVRLDQQLDRLALAGTLVHTGARIAVDATATGDGMRGSALQPWLPEGVTCTLTRGGIRAHLQASTTLAGPDTAADLQIDGLRLHDLETELAAIDRITLKAPAIGRDLVHVASLRVEGIRGAVAATDQGLTIPGFRLTPPPPAFAPKGAGPEPQPKPTAPTGFAAGRLRIDELLFAVERFDFRDRRGGEGAPVAAAVRIELAAPWASSTEIEESPPLQLQLQASARPLVGAIEGTITALPFRRRPELAARITVDGVDTTALPGVLPPLAGVVRGTESTASLSLHAHATLDLHRTDPTHFDVSRAFGLELEVTDLRFASGTGTVLAAVPDLLVQADAIDPRTGDVFLRRVEIEAPELVLRREADGLHALGIVVRAPEPGTADIPATSTAAGDGQRPEFAVGQLAVRGLACDLQDATTTPPTHAPIAELDVTVHGFTSRAATEPRPLAFSLQIRGGDAELERRLVHSSLIAGVLGSTGRLITGENDAHEKELRPIVEEVTATGNLMLFPRPKGTVRARVRGFELPVLRGLAKPSGVEIADGVFDGTVTIDLQPSTTRVKSLSTFRWLSITEPPGGPISTYLRLPAPLDTVLFVLRNADGEQRLPLQFEAPVTGDPSTRIAHAAVEALTLLIGEAVASAPTRVLTTLTHAVGFGGADDLAQRAVVAAFAAGSADGDLAAAVALAAEFAADPEVHFALAHDLGTDDVPVAERLANPPADVVRESVARLRQALDDAERRRAVLAPEVAARFLAGQTQAAETLRQELRAQDDAIGRTQATLAAALDQWTETGARQRSRRTRDACVELGQQRLLAVKSALSRALGPDAANRIELRAPRGGPAPDTATGRVQVTPFRHRG